MTTKTDKYVIQRVAIPSPFPLETAISYIDVFADKNAFVRTSIRKCEKNMIAHNDILLWHCTLDILEVNQYLCRIALDTPLMKLIGQIRQLYPLRNYDLSWLHVRTFDEHESVEQILYRINKRIHRYSLGLVYFDSIDRDDLVVGLCHIGAVSSDGSVTA